MESEYGDNGDDYNDIEEFERRCFGNPHVNYLSGAVDHDKDAGEGSSSEEDEQINRARQLQAPQTAQQWQMKVRVLEEKMADKEQRINQLKEDLKQVSTDANQFAGDDIVADLKAKLIEQTKKNRRLQVTMETQKNKIEALERTPNAKSSKQEPLIIRDGGEEYKQKYLQSSNKLQETRHEMQELRALLHKQKKVLLKELGSQEDLDKALACADDPFSLQWQGRAAVIAQLQRQLKEATGNDQKAPVPEPPKRVQRPIMNMADQRRQEFDKLQENAKKLEDENKNLKLEKDGFKSRALNLEKTVRDLKGHVQVLIEKSENDDKLLQQKPSSEADALIQRQNKIIDSLQQQMRTLSGGTGPNQQMAASETKRTVKAGDASCAVGR